MFKASILMIGRPPYERSHRYGPPIEEETGGRPGRGQKERPIYRTRKVLIPKPWIATDRRASQMNLSSYVKAKRLAPSASKKVLDRCVL